MRCQYIPIAPLRASERPQLTVPAIETILSKPSVADLPHNPGSVNLGPIHSPTTHKALTIWLVNTGEAVAFTDSTPRLRMGLLAKSLAEAGHSVTWWTGDFDHTNKRRIKAPRGPLGVGDGYFVRLLHSPGYKRNVSVARVLHHIGLAVAFYRQSRRTTPAPDVIVVTLPTVESCVAVGLFRKRRRTPYVVDIRDLYPDTYEIAVPVRLRPVARRALTPWRMVAAWALRNATAITAVSDSYLSWGLELAGRSKTSDDVVLPISRVAGTAHLCRATATRLVAIFVGTFGQTYDLDAVIEAARRLALDLDFVLVGDGEKMTEARSSASDLSNVHFAGWCDAETLEAHLANADIGLATFVSGAPQSLPNKLVEYFAAGLPVVNSLPGDAAALIEAEGCGVNYRAGDVDDLCRAIRELLLSSARREACSAAARKVFASRFDSTLVNSRFVSVIEGAAASSGS